VIACKVCGASSSLFGVVDFNKTCEVRNGTSLPLSGVPVWYYRCPDCGFLFTAQFDDWTPGQWKERIYNAEYGSVDPEGIDARPRGNAQFGADVAHRVGARRLLDYGGGAGLLSQLLVEACFDSWSWDMLHDTARPDGDFDLISCFEVFEHTPTPRETLADLLSFLRPGGVVLFSTLTLGPLPFHDASHWYIAPRNGHVSIHSDDSLRLLFGDGWHVEKLSEAYHLARRVG